MTEADRTFDFYCSGQMPVHTPEGVEMRKVVNYDFKSMLRTPEVRDGEMLVTSIDGSQHAIRTHY